MIQLCSVRKKMSNSENLCPVPSASHGSLASEWPRTTAIQGDNVSASLEVRVHGCVCVGQNVRLINDAPIGHKTGDREVAEL